MTSKYANLAGARDTYARGENVTEYLKKASGSDRNTPEIIEVAYDLQAGEYVKWTRANPDYTKAYSSEISAILNDYIDPAGSLLDVGTGEITTFSNIVATLETKPAATFGFDISWSRIFKGLDYSKSVMGAEAFGTFTPFVADLHAIPLCDKSIDVTTSSHALEPNGANLRALLRELFRVTRKKLVLFEPCYEINSPEGRQRMDRHGYIKGVEAAVTELGGKLERMTPLKTVANPLNPTAAFVIEPPAAPNGASTPPPTPPFSVPGTSIPLEKFGNNFWFSKDVGLCFPVLEQIPVLRENAAILASALSTR
jgi:ubiquinone/menaquinone biosynthesis C-methylase UbiE